MEACSDSVFLQRCKIVSFGFCRRYIAGRLEQAAVIEPVDPFQRGVFDCVHGFPRAFPPDDFSLVESVDGFGERIVITVTDAADRRLEACFCQTLCIPDADILTAAIRVMDKAAARTGLRSCKACSRASSTKPACAVRLPPSRQCGGRTHRSRRRHRQSLPRSRRR